MTMHDENGKFAKGNPGGPGRPRRLTEDWYIRIMSSCVTAVDWKEIVEKAVMQAKRGDAGARNWLTRYILGDAPPSLTQITAWDEAGYNPIDDAVSQAKLDRIINGFEDDNKSPAIGNGRKK